MTQKRQHQPRHVVSAPLWCNKCRKETPHAVSDRKITHCIPCADKLRPGYQPPPEYKPSGNVTVIPHACICPKYSFPHYHPDGERYNRGPVDARFAKGSA